MTHHSPLVPILVSVGIVCGVSLPVVATGQTDALKRQVVLQHALSTAECAALVATLEKGAATQVTCRTTDVSFVVRAGASLSTTEIAQAASPGGRANTVVLRSITAFGRVELVLSHQHNPSDDAAFLDALKQRRGVAAASVVSPRRLRLQILPSNPVAVGALVQSYVRALGRKGPTLLTDFLSEVVFHGE